MSDCAYGKGYLLNKLPTCVKYDRWSDKDRNFIGSRKIGHIARKASLKLSGKNSTRTYKSDSIPEETMGFSEVTFECNPKGVESKYVFNLEDVIEGTGDKDLDKEIINAIIMLDFYTLTEQENIFEQKIIKGLTRFE